MLTAYNDAVVVTFVAAAAMAALSILGALGMEWKSVKKESTNEKVEDIIEASAVV